MGFIAAWHACHYDFKSIFALPRQSRSARRCSPSPLWRKLTPHAPESPYGGITVEDIVARVNDQIITRSDYDRAMKEMDEEARQHGASMQEISEAHKDLAA